jgi:hypothetical protein
VETTFPLPVPKKPRESELTRDRTLLVQALFFDANLTIRPHDNRRTTRRGWMAWALKLTALIPNCFWLSRAYISHSATMCQQGTTLSPHTQGLMLTLPSHTNLLTAHSFVSLARSSLRYSTHTFLLHNSIRL